MKLVLNNSLTLWMDSHPIKSGFLCWIYFTNRLPRDIYPIESSERHQNPTILIYNQIITPLIEYEIN